MIKYRISQPPTNPNLPILGDKIIQESDFTADLNEHAHHVSHYAELKACEQSVAFTYYINLPGYIHQATSEDFTCFDIEAVSHSSKLPHPSCCSKYGLLSSYRQIRVLSDSANMIFQGNIDLPRCAATSSSDCVGKKSEKDVNIRIFSISFYQ